MNLLEQVCNRQPKSSVFPPLQAIQNSQKYYGMRKSKNKTHHKYSERVRVAKRQVILSGTVEDACLTYLLSVNNIDLETYNKYNQDHKNDWNNKFHSFIEALIILEENSDHGANGDTNNPTEQYLHDCWLSNFNHYPQCAAKSLRRVKSKNKAKKSNLRDICRTNNNSIKKDKNNSTNNDDKTTVGKNSNYNNSQSLQRDSVQFSTTSKEVPPTNPHSTTANKSQISDSNFFMQGHANADGNFCFVFYRSVQSNDDNSSDSNSSSIQSTPSAAEEGFQTVTFASSDRPLLIDSESSTDVTPMRLTMVDLQQVYLHVNINNNDDDSMPSANNDQCIRFDLHHIEDPPFESTFLANTIFDRSHTFESGPQLDASVSRSFRACLQSTYNYY